MRASITLTVSGSIALILAYLTWQRRQSPNTAVLAVLMLGSGIWALGYALELGQDQLAMAIIWAKVQYVGIVIVPTTWLLFALTYTGHKSTTFIRRTLFLLLPEPLITLLLAWAYPVNHWLWRDVTHLSHAGVQIARFVPGPWYNFNIVYSYVLLFLGTLYITVCLRADREHYRQRRLALLTMVAAPWIGNLLYVFKLTPWSHIDTTPFGFIFAGAAATIGMLRYQLFSIVPIARDLVLETMRDAVITVDVNGVIIDFNRAADDLFELQGKHTNNRPPHITDLLPGLPDLTDTKGHPMEFRGECIWMNKRIVSIDSQVSPLPDDSEKPVQYLELQLMPVSRDGAGFHGYYLLISDIAQRVHTRALQLRDTAQLTNLVSARTSEIETAMEKLQIEIEERRRVESSLRRQNQQLAALNAVASILSQELTFPQALEATLVEMIKLPGVHYAWLLLYPGEPDEKTILAPGVEDIPVERLQDLLAQDIDAVMQAQTSRTLLVPIGQIPRRETCTLMLVPVPARDSILGVTVLVWAPDKYSSSHDLTLIEGICHQIGLATENERLLANTADIEVYQKLSDLRSELIANVSHEIRTPLGLIKLFATALQLDETQFNAERRQEFLTGIEEETEHLEAIVADLLHLGQAARGQMHLDRQLLDLQQLVRRLVSSMRLEFGEHHLARDFSDHPVIVNADEVRLSQVVRNLITNAIKYSPSTGHIRVSVRPEAARAIVSVEDQGVGIPLEEQAHIFERFYRVDNEVTRRTRGTGLGLAISKTIIEAHGGDIWFTSRSGQGSVFSFSLPTASTSRLTRLTHA